ncbi:unnamed protein product [Owenia fusiformis]|uniref:Uncharacterized protein n=1 Tax=Owenia fusiformis TaxID=6347 RepID=A0A8J1UDW8_OWEFU|nr:unnamed protein product [Owenia fusiformis]
MGFIFVHTLLRFLRSKVRDVMQLIIISILIYIVYQQRQSYDRRIGNERIKNEEHTFEHTTVVETRSEIASKSTRKSSNHFLIISNGRAGTHFMMNLLNNHPDVKMYDELLQTKMLLKPKGIMGNKTAILKYLSEELCKLKTFCEQNKKIGFILLNWQISNLAPFLSLNDILKHIGNPKVIVQYRLNTLLSYSSLQIIKENGVINANISNKNVSVEINWHKFENYVIRKRTEWGDTLKCISNRTKTYVSYEELVAEQNLCISRIFKYIGVAEYHGKFGTRITKLNPTSLEERISNYAEIKQYIKEAPKKLLQLNLATEKDVTTLYDDAEIN